MLAYEGHSKNEMFPSTILHTVVITIATYS